MAKSLAGFSERTNPSASTWVLDAWPQLTMTSVSGHLLTRLHGQATVSPRLQSARYIVRPHESYSVDLSQRILHRTSSLMRKGRGETDKRRGHKRTPSVDASQAENEGSVGSYNQVLLAHWFHTQR